LHFELGAIGAQHHINGLPCPAGSCNPGCARQVLAPCGHRAQADSSGIGDAVDPVSARRCHLQFVKVHILQTGGWPTLALCACSVGPCKLNGQRLGLLGIAIIPSRVLRLLHRGPSRFVAYVNRR